MKASKDEKTAHRPLLIVDRMSENFSKPLKNNRKNNSKLSQNEKILLTLIARIIVEIYLSEEL